MQIVCIITCSNSTVVVVGAANEQLRVKHIVTGNFPFHLLILFASP